MSSHLTSLNLEQIEKLTDRLVSRTKKSASGCVLWTGRKGSTGYGYIDVARGAMRTHRLSFTLFVGPIPNGLSVCHRCDTPACLHPMHLFLGTHAENMKDCAGKNRFSRAKLTDELVLLVRKKWATGAVTMAELARECFVSKSTIQDVINHKAWNHVTESELVIDIHSKRRRTCVEAVIEFLEKNRRPQTISQIVAGTGRSLGAVRQVVQRTNRNRFVANKIEGYSRRETWALAPKQEPSDS